MAVAASPRLNRRSPCPLRILTAVPLCDGHDSAIMSINHDLARSGAEVVYLGYHQSAAAIARAAVQEDVHAIGISSYNGGHVEFFRSVMRELRGRGGADIRVFGGGGGTMTPADERAMRRFGVARIFFAGTPPEEIVSEISRCARPLKREPGAGGDRALARGISLAEQNSTADGDTGERIRPKRAVPAGAGARRNRTPARIPYVLGVAGPGGAGKSTLIDELTFRFLERQKTGRIAILANDPSQPGSGGALLGDRVSAIYAQHDRVFFRSLGTRGSPAGISAATTAALDVLRSSAAFDLILVESVGIGQESDPFRMLRGDSPIADAVLFVLAPHYGGRIQLEKTALLHGASLVALNKCDDPRAGTASAEVAASLARDDPRPALHHTIAARHRDPGLDVLYEAIAERSGLDGGGGERPCQLRIDT